MSVSAEQFFAGPNRDAFAVFKMKKSKAQFVGFTKDIPGDCLDYGMELAIRDDAGKLMKIYRVTVPLEIE